jgi:hypothetical protein
MRGPPCAECAFRKPRFMTENAAASGKNHEAPLTWVNMPAQAFRPRLPAKLGVGRVLFAFDDDKQRATWSNFPTSFVPRGGLSLKEILETEQRAWSRWNFRRWRR